MYSIVKEEMKKRPNTERTPSICFTHFRAIDGTNLTKSFSIGPDGTLRKTSHAQPSCCIAWERTLASIHELPAFLDALEPTDAIATGIFDVRKARVIPQGAESETDSSLPARHRTRSALRQPAPGLAMLDHDPSPRMPEHLRCTSPTELMGSLAKVMPVFKELSWVGRGSSSQGVFNQQTGQGYADSGGIHVYIGLRTADLAAFRDALEVALWRSGIGYIELAHNGRRLRRTIIDLSVLSPERLIFEAAPILGPDVGREVPAWEHSHG